MIENVYVGRCSKCGMALFESSIYGNMYAISAGKQVRVCKWGFPHRLVRSTEGRAS